MRKMSKRIAVAALAGIGMLTVGFGTATMQADASIEAPALQVSMEQKAAVRKEGPMGIRFTANVANAAAITEYYGAENVVYGMLIAPADYLTEEKTLAFDGGLTEWTEGMADATNTYRNETAIPNAETGDMYGSFIGIQESNYSRPFAARAYIGVKEEGSEAFSYTYSDVCSRAVYTVASYAVMDTAEGYSDEVMTYLNGVVSKVHTAYNTLNVDLGGDTVFDGTNNTVNLTATVSNGVRTLETGVALTADNMTQKDFTTYEVDTLGEFTATASVGALSVTFGELNCHTLLTDDSDIHVTPSISNAENPTAKTEIVSARGRESVVHWYTDSESGVTNADATLNFDGPFNKANMEGKTVYVTFDLWTNQQIALAWVGHILDSLDGYTRYLYTNDTAYFNEDGYEISSSGLWNDMNAIGRWITIQVAIPTNVDYKGDNSWEGLTFINGFNSNAEIYVDNVKLTTNAIVSMGDEDFGTGGIILADESDLTESVKGNVYVSDSTVSSFTYVEEAAGRKGVFQWATDSATDVKPFLHFADTPANRAWLKTGRYLSFDFYTDAKTSIYWVGPNWLLYNLDGDDNANVKVYDEEGFLITDKKIWTGGLLNTWITFEIKLDRNYPFTQYGGFSVYSSGFNSSTNVYFDNVKVSDTAIVPATVGTEGVILADEADLSNVYTNNTKTSLAYDAAGIGGRTGVFKWSAADETKLSGVDAMLLFTNTKYTSAWLKAGSYLSFDIYLTAPVTLTWYHDPMKYLYSGVGSTDGAKFYDSTGALLTSGSIWGGNFNGQWITIEVCLDTAYNFSSNQRGIGIYSATFNNTTPIYLDNIQVRTTSMSA